MDRVFQRVANAEGVHEFQPGVASTPGIQLFRTHNAESVREPAARCHHSKLIVRRDSNAEGVYEFQPGVASTPGYQSFRNQNAESVREAKPVNAERTPQFRSALPQPWADCKQRQR